MNSNKKTYNLFQINLSSLMTLLTVLFVGLKLCHVIDWNWVWVVSPIWLPFVLIIFAWLIITFFAWLLYKTLKRDLKI